MKLESTLYKETKWLRFMIVDRKPKTVVIDVRNKDDHFLGIIRWHGPWRQYIYSPPSPHAQIIFNNGCLQNIADVLSSLNEEHRGKR